MRKDRTVVQAAWSGGRRASWIVTNDRVDSTIATCDAEIIRTFPEGKPFDIRTVRG
jgi:hypothetical protein